MDEVGDSEKAASRKEVLGVREEEEGVENLLFQFCLRSCILFFCCTGNAVVDSA